MSILSNSVNFYVSKIDPLSSPYIGTILNFVKIYRVVINPLTISQNFISISFFVKKLLQKALGGVHSTSPWAGEG